MEKKVASKAATKKETLSQAVKRLNQVINKKILKDEEVDNVWKDVFAALESSKIKAKEEVVQSFKNQRWIANHTKIKTAINRHLMSNNFLPSTVQIVQDLGLSRQTVTKHLKEFATHDLYAEEIETLELSASMLLERVLAIAMRGDLKAMKFYINTIERRKEATKTSTTHNFIQVNNIFVNNETIKALPEDKRRSIEEIILSENLSILKSETEAA